MSDKYREPSDAALSVSDGGHDVSWGGGRPDRTLDDLFVLLGDARRRAALDYLVDVGEADVDVLVTVVHDREAGPGAPSAEDRTALEISLRHNHIPTLVEAGVVDFDATTGSVGYRGSADLERFLAILRDHDLL